MEIYEPLLLCEYIITRVVSEIIFVFCSSVRYIVHYMVLTVAWIGSE